MKDSILYNYQKRFYETGKTQGWWDSKGLVVAFSGGGDSVCLLWLLRNFYKGRLIAAHLDHNTRDGQSHDDAKFSEQLCKKWGVPIYIRSIKVAERRKAGESFEMAARRERYIYLNKVAVENNLPFIAVGHSADDLIETQLINLFRGTGLKGLRGIPQVNKNIVRPIIEFRRTELRDILKKLDIAWKEDSSNRDSKYLRNRIRNELIPWIKSNVNENFEQGMLGLAKQIESELKEREIQTIDHVDKIAFNLSPSLISWDSKQLKNFSKVELAEMIRLQAERLSLPVLSRKRMEILLGLLEKKGQWRFQWAKDIELCYSERGLGWLHRTDVLNALNKNKGSKKNIDGPWWSR